MTDRFDVPFGMVDDISLACRVGKENPDACVDINGRKAYVCMGQIAIDVETGEILKAFLLASGGTAEKPRFIRMLQFKDEDGWSPVITPYQMRTMTVPDTLCVDTKDTTIPVDAG